MKERTKYILKSIEKYVPFWTGVALTAGLGVLSLTGCVFGMVNAPKLNSYLESPIVQQATEEAKINLANDLASGKIKARDYEQKFEESKLEAAKEIYKNDEEFQAILKRKETLQKVVPIETLLLLPAGTLALVGLYPFCFIHPDETSTETKKPRHKYILPKASEHLTGSELKKFGEEFDSVEYDNEK